MSNDSINRREISIDLLRIVSCFFIILRHVTDNFGLINDHWRTAIFLKSISYPALPLFVMLTGYLIFNKEESYGDFFKKRFNKIFFPFVFWSFIYYEYLIKFINSNINHNFIGAFVSNGIFYHLWYVYFIIGVYLLVPIIRKMLYNLTNRDLIYLILLWGVTSSIFPIIKQYWGVDIGIGFVFSQFWGYIFLGYFIRRLDNKKEYFIITLLVAFSIYLISVIGTILFRPGSEMFLLNYTDVFSVPMITICFCLFYVVRYLNINCSKLLSSRIKKIIISISNLTFSIYLSHGLVLDIFIRGIFGLKINPRFTTPIIGSTLLALLVFVICLIISLIWSQISLLKQFVTCKIKSTLYINK